MPKQNTSSQNTVIFLNTLVPFLLGCMVDLYAPALPAIASSFHAKLHLVQLTISLYVLGYGIGQLLLGVLSDKLGRRNILIFSTILFVIVSTIAAFSGSINMLNFCRFFQGVCIAGLCISCRAAAVDCFSGVGLTRVMNYFYISRSVGIIVGPFVGGYLLHYFNWRADFYFFMLYGLAVLTYAAVIIPETKLAAQDFTIGKIIKTIGEIVSTKVFLYFAIILALIYSSWMAFEVIGPFLIQTVLKFSVIEYGYMLTAAGAAYFIGNSLNHVLINYFKPLDISFVAIICILLASTVMFILGFSLPLNLYIILLPLLWISFLTGFIFPNLTAAALGSFKNSAGTAGAILGAFMSIGVFLISSAASFFKTNTQIPMAIIFVVIAIICTGIFFIWKRQRKIAA